jgi:hypothetical protein
MMLTLSHLLLLLVPWEAAAPSDQEATVRPTTAHAVPAGLPAPRWLDPADFDLDGDDLDPESRPARVSLLCSDRAVARGPGLASCPRLSRGAEPRPPSSLTGVCQRLLL